MNVAMWAAKAAEQFETKSYPNNFSRCLGEGLFVSGVVCSDCFYGWNGGVDDMVDAAKAEMFLATLEQHELNIGHIHDGPYADDSCWHAGDGCEDDCDCERREFSSAACLVCGDTLAGYRHDAYLIARAELEG